MYKMAGISSGTRFLLLAHFVGADLHKSVLSGELTHFLVVFSLLCHLCLEDKECTGCLGRDMIGS